MNKKICFLLIIYFLYNDHEKNKQIINMIITLCNAQKIFQELAINTIPTPPKIKNNINWRNIFLPIIQEMLLVPINKTNEKNHQTLFIYTIENISNNTIKTHQTTHTLINLLNNLNSHFIIINSKIPNHIHNNFNLFNNNLTQHNKAIKVSRYINAQYILFCTIYNISKKTYLETQLILVRTGEITWSKIIPLFK